MLFKTNWRVLCLVAVMVQTLAMIGISAAAPQQTQAAAGLHLRDVKAVAAGGYHTCALLNSGKVKCWGKNDNGQLGDASVIDSIYPVEVAGINNAEQIAAGGEFTCIINSAGAVKCWGDDLEGQLGDGNPAPPPGTPATVALPAGVTASKISAGYDHVCAIATDGDAYCWGSNFYNSYQQSGVTNKFHSPLKLTWGPRPAVALATGTHSTCLADATSVVCAGYNLHGQLGRGFTSLFETPPGVAVPGLSNIVAVSLGFGHACATQFALVFAVSCWGGNEFGEAGTGVLSDPVLAPSLITTFRTVPAEVVTGDFFSCARLIDGTVQCWGANYNRGLGVGSSVSSNSRVPVPTDAIELSGAVDIDTGGRHVCAVIDSGEVKCWGNNTGFGDDVRGILGTGDTAASSIGTPSYVLERPATLETNPIDLGDVLSDVPTSGLPDYEYGDAPDGGVDAYPGVLGRFPTLDDSDAKGPKHNTPARILLGDSSTKDAAVDEDGIPNVIVNTANLDGGDDGWLNQDELARFDNCQTSTVRLRIRRSASTFAALPVYINAWIDGNRDGDFGDSRPCETGDPAFEWFVQNRQIRDLPAAGGFIDIDVITRRVLSNSPVNPAWVRFTLSDRPAQPPAAPADALPDGRGPATGTFDYGETEDYLWDPVTDREKYGSWAITKTVLSNGEIAVGSTFTYVIDISRSGGSAPSVVAALADVLPAQTALAGSISVNIQSPIVTPTTTLYQPGFGGPSGRVIWVGAMSDGARFRVRIPVRVDICPGTPVTNTAVLVLPGAGKVLTSMASTSFSCTPPPPPTVSLNKRMVNAMGSSAAPTQSQLTETVFRLALTQNNVLTTMMAAMEDVLPVGLSAVETLASRGVVSTTNGGRTVRWLGALGPSLAPPQVWIRARVSSDAYCGRPLSNTAQWFLRHTDGTIRQDLSNTAIFTPDCAPPPTLTPTPRPTNTPVPVATNTSVPLPTDAPPGAPTYTPVPRATNTSVPLPPPTNTPVPVATNTSVPLPADAPEGAATYTPVPRATNTSVPIISPGEGPARLLLPLMMRS